MYPNSIVAVSELPSVTPLAVAVPAVNVAMIAISKVMRLFADEGVVGGGRVGRWIGVEVFR